MCIAWSRWPSTARPPFAGAEVAHLNGDPTDNRQANLACATRAQNTRHRKWHAPRPGRLSPAQVARIKRLLAEGVPARSLAASHGVSGSSIHAIRTGRSHADVAPEAPGPEENFLGIAWPPDGGND
jgi:hypothetical protein